jgi:hypothetical protein
MTGLLPLIQLLLTRGYKGAPVFLWYQDEDDDEDDWGPNTGEP